MSEPVWLDHREATAINHRAVAQFGGVAAGVRDENHLKAALARPLNRWHYDEPRPDMHTLAAAYGFGIAKGHVFYDGNKRTAYLVAVVFLALNGIDCTPEQGDIVKTMVAVADGGLSEQGFADWLRRNSRAAG